MKNLTYLKIGMLIMPINKRKFSNYNFAILMGLIAFIFSSCETVQNPNDDIIIVDSTKINTGAFEIALNCNADMGSIETKFEFSVEVNTETEEKYYIRWDFDNDGHYDTDWLDSLHYTRSFTSSGIVSVQVINEDSYSETDSVKIFLGELENITNNMSSSGTDNLDIHPDGIHICYNHWPLGANEHQIWEYNMDDGSREMIIGEPAHFPDYSFDGRYIAYDGDGGIRVWDSIDGTDTLIISDPLTLANYVRWSPIDNTFLYDSDDGLLLVDFTTGTYSVLFPDRYGVQCWSPDGQYIALSNVGVKTVYIYRLSNLELVQTFENLPIGEKMDWSPDGKWLSLGVRIYPIINILDYESEKIYKMIPGELNSPWYPSWSVDGKSLYFEGRGDDGHLSIYRMEFPSLDE